MEEVDIWELIENDEFEKACLQADIEFSETGNELCLSNKVIALLNLKKYSEVISLENYLIKRNGGNSDANFINKGISLWAMGDLEEAYKVWVQAEKCLYQSVLRGFESKTLIFLYGIFSKNEKILNNALKSFSRMSKKKGVLIDGIIASFFCDIHDEQGVLSNISTIPILKEREYCKVRFAFALKHLLNNNTAKFKDNLNEAIIYGSKSYLEPFFYMSKILLESPPTSKVLTQ